jgi:hypothetical protein
MRSELVMAADDVGVDERSRESRDLMQQLVLAALGDAMPVDHAQIVGNDDRAFRPQLVADPPHPRGADVDDSVCTTQDIVDLIDQ